MDGGSLIFSKSSGPFLQRKRESIQKFNIYLELRNNISLPVDPQEVPSVVHEEVDDAYVEGDLPDHPPELGHVHRLVGPHLRLVLSQ